MDRIFEGIIDEAVKAGQFSILVLLAGIATLAMVIIILWRSYNAALKRCEELHEENEALLREMLEQTRKSSEEKTKMVEQINQTIALILASAQQPPNRP